MRPSPSWPPSSPPTWSDRRHQARAAAPRPLVAGAVVAPNKGARATLHSTFRCPRPASRWSEPSLSPGPQSSSPPAWRLQGERRTVPAPQLRWGTVAPAPQLQWGLFPAFTYSGGLFLTLICSGGLFPPLSYSGGRFLPTTSTRTLSPCPPPSPGLTPPSASN